jgi:DNA-binding NarL/FixJ family response regulator
LDALDLLATGLSDLKIAIKLGLSRQTVKQYLSSASLRIGLPETNRIKLAICAGRIFRNQ